VFFRVLKQGWQIEQLRLQTKARLVNALASYLIVAWRMHAISRLGRAYPEVSCEGVFAAPEWQTIYTMQAHRPPPQVPPPLREIVRRLAHLGGFLARKGDGEPGVQTLWQGYQRLQDFLYALDTHRAVTAS
jgi:Transposase Tn5 dimerisation domain